MGRVRILFAALFQRRNVGALVFEMRFKVTNCDLDGKIRTYQSASETVPQTPHLSSGVKCTVHQGEADLGDL